jgi:hypothetical protein
MRRDEVDMQRRLLLFLFLLFLATTGEGLGPLAGREDATRNEKASSSSPSYQSQIRPLLQAKCTRCHGEKVRKADLNLLTPEGIRKGGESGPVIVPGKPDDSPLYEKIHGGAMPPAKKDRLNAADVDMIRRWVVAGALFDSPENAPSSAVTQHDVIPILLRRCTVCHGRHRQEGGLDLRTKAAMLRGGKSGPALVPGKPQESRLIQKVRDAKMPPADRLVEVSVKPIEPAEIAVLARWIAQGAPEVAIAPDVASTTADPEVSDKERDFWAFRSPKPVVVPDVSHRKLVRNPIDAFILQKLEKKGLTLAPESDRCTLIRRAALDLTGLPPDPADAQAFVADRSADAYDRMIDRLLASPRYGERWGRYWLDLAGYADSEGKREQDLPRPHAWRYRDYVVRSVNADKPYTRFLLEQLAGDELADYEHAREITEELYDNLVATGFLRMAPDATWANITGYVPDRMEVVADEIEVLGSAVMGLTMKCARCHSHKFDPIPQRDYYRLVDVFKGAFDEHDWLKPDVRPGLGPVSQDVLPGRLLPYVTSSERRARQEHNDSIQKQIAALRSAGVKDRAAKIRALQAKVWPQPRIQALWDRGQPSPTYIYRRGDPNLPGKLVGPGVPSVLTDGKTPFEVQPPWPGAKKTGRRLAFARWLIRPDHPLTSRVAVNRLWRHHFGTGIVTTLDNFGKAGARPTHPELLDWLAREFVRQEYSLKKIHRLMMTSAVYRQRSAVAEAMERLDPDNRLYSRMPLVRLDAEALYDTLLLVAGRLDERPFGPADAVGVRPDGLTTPARTGRGWRRIIYVRQARKQMPTHLELFDFPQMNPNCLARRDSTVAPQALHLLNNGMVQQLAESFAERVRREVGSDPARQIERAYWIALSRPPGEEERAIGAHAMRKLTERWGKHLTIAGKVDIEAAERKALASYCHAIVNSAAFVYVD